MKSLRIYVASPYSVGDKLENVNLQIDVGEILFNHGYIPHIPLFNHYWNGRYAHTEEHWLKIDFAHLKTCDILIRIKPIKDGVEIPSRGADREEALANELNIPVFTFNSVDELSAFLNINKFTLFE